MIGLECVNLLEFIHSRNFLHRDIKPENFLIGDGRKEEVIHLIDFGLAKRFRDPKTGNHISFKRDKGTIGTSRVASLNAAKGNE